MASVRLLLPDAARFGGQRLGETAARVLGRADRVRLDGTQRERLFEIHPAGWPAAAATRQMDAGDAAGTLWLRADPAHIRPDINGARLLAHGPGVQLTVQDTAAFMPALRPLFGDAGFPIDAPVPSRWYLRLPPGSPLPAFSPPEDALGDELFEHLPGIGASGDAESRRWRTLLSEVQVVLHNHPRNAERIETGLAAVNSLWFWGGGMLPDRVRCEDEVIYSDDDSFVAFARLASAETHALPDRCPGDPGEGGAMIDLRDLRDLSVLQRDWLDPLISCQQAGDLDEIVLDCSDGHGFVLRRNQRLRFWRQPRSRLGG